MASTFPSKHIIHPMAVLNKALRAHALLIDLPNKFCREIFELCILTFVGT
jgi:hypothetical protein